MICCLKCYNIFKEEQFKLDKNKEVRCPIKTCMGKLIELDELIYPVIFTLNKKGYKTHFCCSGHAYDTKPDTYITFVPASKYMYSEIFSKIKPVGFNIEVDDEKFNQCRITLRNRIDIQSSEYDKSKIIINNISSLMEWAESLPNYNYSKINHVVLVNRLTKTGEINFTPDKKEIKFI